MRGIITNFCCYDRVFHRFRPDIIHVHMLEFRFPFAYFAGKGRIPIVATIHSFNSIEFSAPIQSEKYHKLVASNLRLSRNLIFVSHYVEKRYRQLFGDDNTAKCWVIHNPTDVGKYHPVDKDEARRRIGLCDEIPVLLFVGNMIKRKGIHILLEAVEILQKKDKVVRVVIVGDGPERQGIDDFVVNNGIGDIVKVEGQKQYPELLYYYNAADLFVMSSLSETFGLVYIEAMLCGVPIIGTNVTAMPEVIPSEDYGFLVPPVDPSALAEAIERGLNKEWDKEKIVTYARSFDWDKRIAEFEKVYKEIKAKR